MPHDVSLIATIAVGFGLALVLGYGAMRLKMPDRPGLYRCEDGEQNQCVH